MLVRRIARPLLSAWFVGEGLDAVRYPAAHVARTQAAWQQLGRRVDLPPAPSPMQLTALVRAHGAAMTVAGAMLATGRAPRAAALTLAALTLPLAVVNQPFGSAARVVATASDTAAGGERRRMSFGRSIGATGGVSTAQVAEGGADRGALTERFLRNLSMIGGALIAGIDREGRPGVAWRAGHARVDRAAAAEAKRAMVAAAYEARAAVREARRSAP
jgi:uncharacterized membrane protein YphA (DoxX/SURF4 family)